LRLSLGRDELAGAQRSAIDLGTGDPLCARKSRFEFEPRFFKKRGSSVALPLTTLLLRHAAYLNQLHFAQPMRISALSRDVTNLERFATDKNKCEGSLAARICSPLCD
jgi:hypothetical protein